MSNSGLDSLHELIPRLEQLTNECDVSNATAVDLKIDEEYFSKLLQLEKLPELLTQNLNSYMRSVSITNRISTRQNSDPNIGCKCCGMEIQARCHDCNEYLCGLCGRKHEEQTELQLTKHFIEFFPPPIGSNRNSSPPSESSSSGSSPSYSQILRRSHQFKSLEWENDLVRTPNSDLATSSQNTNEAYLAHSFISFTGNPGNYCYLHTQYCRFVCLNRLCRKFICTKCISCDHREHIYMTIAKFSDCCTERIKNTMHHTTIGLQKIKGKIDEVLRIQYRFERDCIDLKECIDRMLQQLGILSDSIIDFHQEKIQLRKRDKLSILQDQMVYLKAVLAAFSEICTNLHNITLRSHYMNGILVAKIYFDSEARLEQLGKNYRSVQPKNWCIYFSPPVRGFDEFGNIFCGELGDINWEEMRAIQQESLNIYLRRRQNALDDAKKLAMPNRMQDINNINKLKTSPISQLLSISSALDMTSSMHTILTNSRSLRTGTSTLLSAPSHASSAFVRSTDESIIHSQSLPNQTMSRSAQCRTITSSDNKKENSKEEENNNFPLPQLLVSFGQEGKLFGEVCRPWGICTDLNENIIVSDRRNHRVQVFSSDGIFKYSFGHEGDGDGEFQLPAGICVDLSNRIIVVDKDNHRVQIFSIFGRFLLKFGKLGKDRGQFQYPWGVAVNSKQQLVVTDSRNHRVQQFDSEGRFIRSISFEFGITKPSPRGISYNSDGLLLVSDFDNHCLYLVDLDHRTILRSVGGEGYGLQHFNRPSGISVNKSGIIAVADSKNQRILILNKKLKVIWNAKIGKAANPRNIGSRDRVCDIAFISDNRLAFISELSPDEKQLSDPSKAFLHIIKLPEFKTF